MQNKKIENTKIQNTKYKIQNTMIDQRLGTLWAWNPLEPLEPPGTLWTWNPLEPSGTLWTWNPLEPSGTLSAPGEKRYMPNWTSIFRA